MKNVAFWTLVALNVALAGGVAVHMLGDTPAGAQQRQASSRDDYLMMPGEIVGGTNAIVYVLDETTHQLSSMSYDDAQRQLVTMPPRDLNRDFDAMGGVRGNAGNGRGGR